MQTANKNAKLWLILGGVLLLPLIIGMYITHTASSSVSKEKEPLPQNAKKETNSSNERWPRKQSLPVNSVKPDPQLELARATRSVIAWNDQDKLWAKNRKPSFSIEQSGKLWQGNITQDGKSFDLGENPPYYMLQLKTTANDLLFGRYPDRKKIVRTISHVSITENNIRISHDFQISIPSVFESHGYGFVFNREESEISKIGIIIPNTEVPKNINPYDYQVDIRYKGRTFAVYDHSSVKELPEVSLDESKVVLLGPELISSNRVRVLWLEIDSENGFDITDTR